MLTKKLQSVSVCSKSEMADVVDFVSVKAQEIHKTTTISTGFHNRSDLFWEQRVGDSNPSTAPTASLWPNMPSVQVDMIGRDTPKGLCRNIFDHDALHSRDMFRPAPRNLRICHQRGLRLQKESGEKRTEPSARNSASDVLDFCLT